MPMKPPAVLTAGQPPSACARVGTPRAMLNRPSPPTSIAVQPISAGGSAELRSGWRKNRQPTRANSTGMVNDPSPTTALVSV